MNPSFQQNSKIPDGDLKEKWNSHRFSSKLVNPANKRKFSVLIVGTGLAGSSAAASLAELGYKVKVFCLQDSPRRAHSIAAQGGINAAKNYPNDGDSVDRLFYDTIKGGDFRSREANVYRLAEISNSIIDQCVAQGVPFAREYGGLLDNRSFGGAQVSRTFYARGQTGQQLLLGAYASMMRQAALGQVEIFPRREMLDLVLVEGQARGIIVRNITTGKLEAYAGEAVLLATGGYGNVFFLSTNAKNSNATAAWRCHKKGADFANPCFTQIHPTCIPVSDSNQSKLTLMSESLRNDGRVWVPKEGKTSLPPHEISEEDRDYYLERIYPSFGNLVPRDVASRQAKFCVDQGKGVGASKRAVYLDFQTAIKRDGEKTIRSKYGNLFQMYQQITGENPYNTPMRIYPAVHYTMGGLWVDYNLESTISGLYVLGEANFSDHGANRLGASALMQGLADGYFIIPSTLSHFFASQDLSKVTTEHPAFQHSQQEVETQIQKILSVKGKRSADDFHRSLGEIMWEWVGMSRNEAGLKKAVREISQLREEFWQNIRIPGKGYEKNSELEKAGRVADFLELGELMAWDALDRKESCGAHFREEYQTQDNEAIRNDKEFCYVSVWKKQNNPSSNSFLFGEGKHKWFKQKEFLNFKNVKLATRSYK